MPTTSDRPVARLLIAAVAMPLTLTVVAAWLLWSWRDDLPDPVARHWGTAGADGFSSLSTMVIVTVVLGAVFTAIGAVLAVVAHDRWTARMAIGAATGTAAFVVGLSAVSIGGQRGLADAADAVLPGWWILVMIAAGVLIGVTCAAMVPAWSVPAPPDSEAVPADAVALGADERAVWTQTVGTGAAGAVIVVAAALSVVVGAVLSGQWWMLVIAAAVLGLFVAMASVRVVVDHRGVTVHSRFGWPRFHTALSDIERAEKVHVNAIRNFGGYGIRLAAIGPYRGARGLVLRSGEALALTRVDGGRELVVVDDAATAARLVNGLVLRARR